MRRIALLMVTSVAISACATTPPAAADANLPRRLPGAGNAAVPNASATSAAATDGLPRRHHGSRRRNVPDAAPAAADGAAADRPVGRTRLKPS